MSLHVLISCTHLQREMHRYHDSFVERGITYDCPDFSQQLIESELLEIIERYDGVIAGDDELTAKVIERGDKLGRPDVGAIGCAPAPCVGWPDSRSTRGLSVVRPAVAPLVSSLLPFLIAVYPTRRSRLWPDRRGIQSTC